jgi:cobalamin biosynthesis protein CbiD
MGDPTSEVGYTLATTERGTTKSVWTCGGIGKKIKYSYSVYVTHKHFLLVNYYVQAVVR